MDYKFERVSEYADIIDLPHPVSASHPQMSVYDRAAQFSPFAALSGYEGAIQETARRTEKRVELDESEKSVIDEQLKRIQAMLTEQPEVRITYFLPDEYKEGGAYVTATGHARKIETVEHVLILREGDRIPIPDMIAVDIINAAEP